MIPTISLKNDNLYCNAIIDNRTVRHMRGNSFGILAVALVTLTFRYSFEIVLQHSDDINVHP